MKTEKKQQIFKVYPRLTEMKASNSNWIALMTSRVVTLGFLMFHKDVPWYAKAIMWAAIIHWISPVDFIMGIPG